MKKPKPIKKRSHKRSLKKLKTFKKDCKKSIAYKSSRRVSKYNLEELCRQHQAMMEAGVVDDPEFIKEIQEWLNLKPVGKEIFW